MTWLEWFGLLGSIASIIGAPPAITFIIEKCISCFEYIRGKHLYNKIIKSNPVSLTAFYRKANSKKRQHYREQAIKLREDIGRVSKDNLNLGLVYETLMNMIDNIEKLDEE